MIDQYPPSGSVRQRRAAPVSRPQARGTSAAVFVCALAACQPEAFITVPGSPGRVVQTSGTPQTTLAMPVPEAERWRLRVSPGNDGTYRIHVADADGREHQVIDGQEGEPPYEASALLELGDFTGDGHPDILARGRSVGASALVSESIYVYDVATERFLDAVIFDNAGEVTRTGPDCIAVEHRNPDNMTYAKDHYCWRGRWIRTADTN